MDRKKPVALFAGTLLIKASNALLEGFLPCSDLGHRRIMNAASRLLPILPHPRFALVDQDGKS